MATAKKPATKKAPAKKAAPKKATAPELTPAQKIVANVPESERAFAETLASVALALKDKLETKLPAYNKMELVQAVTSTQGEKVLKANPFVSEFRATARDYAAILRDLHELVDAHGGGKSDNLVNLNDIKKRYNIG